jgi:hypothetical protein
LKRVSNEAEIIVVTGPPGYHWHTFEILSALAERHSSRCFGELINEYVVDLVLQKFSRLKRVGRMIWKLDMLAMEFRIRETWAGFGACLI